MYDIANGDIKTCPCTYIVTNGLSPRTEEKEASCLVSYFTQRREMPISQRC